MFSLIDSFSFIWDLNDQPAQTENCDKEVEDLSPYNEGTGEGSSASQASNSYTYVNGTLTVTIVWKF